MPPPKMSEPTFRKYHTSCSNTGSGTRAANRLDAVVIPGPERTTVNSPASANNSTMLIEKKATPIVVAAAMKRKIQSGAAVFESE